MIFQYEMQDLQHQMLFVKNDNEETRLFFLGSAPPTTLMSDIFAGRKFRGSKKPRNFCIFAEFIISRFVDLK